MNKIIMIKYAELTTKKGNRGYFVKMLKNNIMDKLEDLDYELEADYVRMFIKSKSTDEIIERLKKIFGIHEIVLSYKLDSNDIEQIKSDTLKLVKEKKFNTFKVETKRSLKTYPIKSMEVSRVVGTNILKNVNNIKVDVNNPDLLVNVEIRSEGTFIYCDTYKGLGGYPVGALGKGLLMLSGGIDSPVAGFLATKRGVRLEYIYFDSPPHTSLEAKNKVITLAKKISEYGPNTKLHVINFTKIQESILKNCPHDYLITIMRRMMYRICERVCYKEKLLAIFNGENIGQVASQTLTSMKVINEVVTTPIIRPLATYDKLEIIELANKIDTYETSILPYEDCCTVFVPEHPVINPKSSNAVSYENNFDYESLIDEAVNNHEVININNKEEKNIYL